jgi:hypothetical protein
LLDRFRKVTPPSALKPLDSCGVMLSYQCQLGCRHCLYAGGPAWRTWMGEDTLSRLLEGINEVWGRPKGVRFSGGEPFLRFELLLHGVREARRLRLPIEYVETSGSWFRDDDASVDMLRQLREAGLRSILISASPFHVETMPLARTVAVIEAAIEVFGRRRVLIFQHRWLNLLAKARQDKEGSRPIPLGQWVARNGVTGAGKLLWQGYGLIAGGRAGLELGELVARFKPSYFAGHGCRAALLESGHAHFDPYGNYMPNMCGGISLGDTADLPAFLAGFDPHRLELVSVLINEGPYGLACLAEERFGWKPDPGGYAAKCHLCVAVRRHLARNAEGQFPELSPRQYYERLATRRAPLSPHLSGPVE